MAFEIRGMEISDYDQMLDFWRNTPGVGLSSADSREAIGRFLERNPELCFVAHREGKLVGTIMAGNDGRRGYLYHVAVDPACRRSGIGQTLVEYSLNALKQTGIEKCHLVVFAKNEIGNAFWSSTGWVLRDDLLMYSKDH